MRKLYVLLLGLHLGLLPVWQAAPAHAADNGSWSVYPVASRVAARPYFSLSADPGQTLTDKVAVQNKTGLVSAAGAVTGVLLVRARRGRARRSVRVRRSRRAVPTPSRPRSSPSARR